MTSKDLEINRIIMHEIGLEVDSAQRIIDQDTGAAIRIDGMDVVAPGCVGRQVVEFDPFNNKKMMSQLFSYFASKQADETGVGVSTYYGVGHGEEGKIECKMEDNTVFTSKPYMRDSLKLTDIIMQMNGGGSEDLSKYDGFPNKGVKGKKRKSAR